MAIRIQRLLRSCSSACTPLSFTCERSFQNLGSRPVGSSAQSVTPCDPHPSIAAGRQRLTAWSPLAVGRRNTTDFPGFDRTLGGAMLCVFGTRNPGGQRYGHLDKPPLLARWLQEEGRLR